jgi:hypothetical protein
MNFRRILWEMRIIIRKDRMFRRIKRGWWWRKKVHKKMKMMKMKMMKILMKSMIR